MGNKQHSIRKECGYRVLSVKEGSPLQGQLEPYFDYIVDMSCQPSPKEILQKLTDEPRSTSQKPLLVRLREQEGRKVVLKVFSGKDRSLSQVEFVPNANWSDNKSDLIGVILRLERYEEVQDNYCMVTKVKPNSPIAKALVKEGEYLIAVQEFKYESVSELTDKLYERLYDPEVKDKRAQFVIYNILKDEIRLVPIELKKKWGGDGLLGCELSQGHLYRFPQNIEKYRTELKEEEKKKEELLSARKQLSNSDGAGRLLAESLKRRTNNLPKRKLIIRNPERVQELKQQLEQHATEQYKQLEQPTSEANLEERVWRLERAVDALQRALFEQPEQE